MEKINFQLHKKRHTPIREKFTILPIKNVTARQKNVKSWFNIFFPLKKSIIALKMVFTDTFNFQKKTTPLRFKQISEQCLDQTAQIRAIFTKVLRSGCSYQTQFEKSAQIKVLRSMDFSKSAQIWVLSFTQKFKKCSDIVLRWCSD